MIFTNSFCFTSGGMGLTSKIGYISSNYLSLKNIINPVFNTEKISLIEIIYFHLFYSLSEHSFLLSHEQISYGLENSSIVVFLTIFSIGFITDLIFYYIGKFLSNKLFFKNLNYDFPKFFYIFFRFIPLIGAFSVLIGSTLTDKHDFKKDLLKILIGNILFILASIALHLTIFLVCKVF
ncbi:hypothetical protein DLH72_02635 [Candidatus Gracilibacteria bacterium]|nr:MAG: hypothetical protein DLH72_02635 [Candidatus Gracilibacteria bacterium]